MQNLGIKARDLAVLLMEHPDLDVIMEDVPNAIGAADGSPDVEGKHIPLQRVAGVKVAHIRADYDDINLDIDYQDEPFPGSKPVLRIRGVNTAELTD